MKKLFVLMGLVLFGFSAAAAWGLLPSMPDGTSLLFRYLGHEQIVQPVCVRTAVAGEEKQYVSGLPANRISADQLISMEEKALNYWFSQVRQAIEQSGRSTEFSDFLAVWPKRVVLKKQANCEGENILILNYVPYYGYTKTVVENGKKVVKHVENPVQYEGVGRKALATATTEPHAAFIDILERIDYIPDLQNTLTHETGHLLGLADQYGYADFINYETNIHPYFSFLTVLENNTWTTKMNRFKVKSIFGEDRHQIWRADFIWPDDVDGAINAADFVQVYERGQFSPRVSGGWKSFSLADKNIYYAYSMPFEYKGDPAQVLVPDALLARVESYQKRVGQINIADIRKMENLYREAKQYQAQVAAKIEELKKDPGLDVDTDKHALAELSDQELQKVMARARVNYYDKRLFELEGTLLYGFDSLHNETEHYRSKNYERDLENNTAFASRVIDGKRYFSYDPQVMKQLFEQLDAFKKKFPDYPNPDGVQTEELKQTEAKYVIAQKTQKHCGVCGKALNDDDDPAMKMIKNPTRYYYVCAEHASKAPARNSRYLFKTPEAASGKVISVTYAMAQSELRKRQTHQQVKTDLQNSNLTALSATAAVAPKTPGQVQDEGQSALPVKTVATKGVSSATTYSAPAAQKAVSLSSNVPTKPAGQTGHSAKAVTPKTGAKPTSVSASKAGDKAPQATLKTPQTTGPKPPVQAVKVAPLAPAVKAEEKVSTSKSAPAVKTEEKAPTPVRCEICGKEIYQLHYYKTGEHTGVHANHSQCAYDYFAKHYSVDDKALASYDMTYLLHIPAEVAKARALMRALDLTMSDLRRYRSQARFFAPPAQAEVKPATQKNSLSTQFLQAVATFQQNAAKGIKDKQGLIEGIYPVIDLYFEGRNKQTYLETMEWFVSLDRALASGSRYGTISSYIGQVLNGKKEAAGTSHYAAEKLNQMRKDFKTDQQLFPAYKPVAQQVRQLRVNVAKLTLDKDVAQAAVARDKLTQAQQSEVENLVALFKPLAQTIRSVKDQTVLKEIARGLSKNQFRARNAVLVDVEKIWASYGYYTPHTTQDGPWQTQLGERLIQLAK